MKIVIVGGHLSPALAVIDALPKDAEILVIGRKYTFEGDRVESLEYKTIKALNITYKDITSGRLQRRWTRHTIPSLFKIPYGFIHSIFILKNFKPDVVLSFGGYLSLPIDLSAFILGIPVVIHEQTLEAGLANKIVSHFASKICISWDSSRKFFPRHKTVITGNPIRKFRIPSNSAFRKISEFRVENKDNLPIIYITGGSSGSHYINTLVEGCIKELLEKFIVIHQTGDAQEYKDHERLNNLRGSISFELQERYFLMKFVLPQEVGPILEKADLVIGRSGMNTVTELIYFGKPSLLIPLPYSQNNEQLKNAKFLKDRGLAEILLQDGSDRKEFLRTVNNMFDNIDKYRAKYKLSGQNQITEDAAKKIAEVVYNEANVEKKQKR